MTAHWKGSPDYAPSDGMIEAGAWHNHRHNSEANMIASFKAMMQQAEIEGLVSIYDRNEAINTGQPRNECSAPPVEAKPAEGGKPDLEAVARIIDPEPWAHVDRWYVHGERINVDRSVVKPSVDKARAILALIPARDEAALPEPVGVAGSMPGTNGGFTTAVFKASDAPKGTKLYAHPATGTDELPADVVRLVKAALAIDEDFQTSENHHPRHVLIPTVTFDAIREASAPFASRVPLNEGESR